MDDSDDDYVDNYDSGSVQPRRRPARRTARENDDTGAGGSYSWEDEYHRSWDIVQEDAGGSLAGLVAGMVEGAKKRRITNTGRPVRRGIIRNLVLVLDLTQAMTETDMRPNRLQAMVANVVEFVSEFFNQNPISQLAIVTIRDGLASLLSPLDGNPYTHLDKLQTLKKTEPAGVPSLQNALEMARAVLFHVPPHNTREVLLIFGSLMSNDPGDINQTIKTLINDKIRVRIIGLAAQVAICSTIARETNFGDSKAYAVVLNEQHFKILFNEITTPLAVNSMAARNSSALVEMGFPPRVSDSQPSLCACHSKLTKVGYRCPRCASKVCTLPMLCPVCNLTLILSTHLARPYHHLFPLASFKETTGPATTCYSCLLALDDKAHKYECPKCENKYCIDCDVFCHETLHNCPGCEESK